MNKSILWVLAVVIIAGGLFLYSSKASAPTVSENTEAPAQEAVDTDTGAVQAGTVGTTVTPAASMSATVTYDGNTFSPSSVTIKKGGTVTFTSTAGDMWVASNVHPSHAGYSGTTKTQHCPDTAGTAFDECSAGTSYTFTFQQTGSWGYHNHKNPSQGGVVTVTQ